MGDECAVHLDQAGDLPVELRVARGRGNAAPYNAPMDLIDIGANLTHDSFDHDRDAVLQRARDAGVARIVITGASREHSPKALALAQAHPGELFATAGVHPHHAVEYTDECDAEMRALHAQPEVIAVGECGLDYFRDFSPRPAQRKAFERQLQIGVDTGKPLFLHQRDAHADFMAMMKNFDGRLGPAVVHCFTGTREEAQACVYVLNGRQLDYPIYFDTEASGAGNGRADGLGVEDRTKCAVAFCEEVKALGYKPGVYASTTWFRKRLDMSQLSNYYIWNAHYNVASSPIACNMWQGTCTARIPGYGGQIDVNISYMG